MELFRDGEFHLFLFWEDWQGRQEGKLDMCKAMDYWRNELKSQGMAFGMIQGEARGITKITTLMARLYADGRTEDVRLISTDAAVLENLLKEYGLDVNSD